MPRPVPAHGTHAMWRRHLRAGEEPCRACSLARAAYMVAWRQKRKAEVADMAARLRELERSEAG